MCKKLYLTLFLLFTLLITSQAHNFKALIFMKSSPTALDYAAQAAIVNQSALHLFTVASTADPNDLNTSNLANYGVIIFLNRNGDGLSASQKTAVEQFMQSDKGVIVLNSGLQPTTGWNWWDDLVTSYVISPSISSTSGTVIVADPAHPSTRSLPQEWGLTEAWYNLSSNPRGTAHVLATLDASNVNGTTMGLDHPVSWCQDYDGGRVWCTSLGGSSAIYTDSDFLEHLVGGIEWAAKAELGDAGATIESNYSVSILNDNNTDPMAMDVAPDGRVFFVQKNGVVNVYKPSTGTTVQAAWQPVFPGGENGLMGMCLDQEFPTRPYIYLHYTHQDGNWGNTGPGTQRVSRFVVNGDQVNLSSEEILLSYTIERDAGIHSGGCLSFDGEGNLLIATGDNTSYGTGVANPYAPIDERSGNEIYDAQRSSADTDDFRGKILRITPSPTINGGYSIPSGNLFTATDSTLAEIYVMGVRNPFKFTVDTATQWIVWGDVGPDAVADNPSRGPIGKDEFNLAKAPGNFGWPYFVGNNSAYRDYDFTTSTSGPYFNPAAPYNNSPHSTGKKNLPPAQPALIWMDKVSTTPEWPMLGGGNATAIAGAFYHYDSTNTSNTKLPGYFDKALFIMDWSRNWVKEVKLDANGNVLKINPFLPSRTWLRPMDMKIGADGAMYILEWDMGWGGGSNPDSRILKIEYTPSGRSPNAVIETDKGSGPLPLTVAFDASNSFDPEGNPITYSWDFGDGSSPSSLVNPSHTFNNAGVYNVQLSVSNGNKVGRALVQITAGNSEPTITITKPVDGGFFEWDDFVQFEVEVSDIEDGATGQGTINCSEITNQVLLGHDSHAHPASQISACNGSFQAGAAGHVTSEDEIFYLFQASYTDQGATGTGTLTGSKIHRLNPKLKQAEHFSQSSGVSLAPTSDALSVSDVVDIDDGDYLMFEPMNLQNITSISFRVAAGGNGGTIEVHKGLPNGATSLVTTATIPSTGSYLNYTTVSVPVNDPGGTDAYYFVFNNPTQPTNLFYLNWILFDGSGIGTVFPVEMSDFQVKAVGGMYVSLNWETLYEVNSDYFEVERTTNPNQAAEGIAQVAAAGNSSSRMSYAYQDMNPHPGTSFYRLVEVDIDGQRHYTEWQQVNFSPDQETFGLQVFPNPARDILNVFVVAEENEVQLMLTQASGQVLAKERKEVVAGERATFSFDLRGQPAGIYLLKVRNGKKVQTRKLSLIH